MDFIINNLSTIIILAVILAVAAFIIVRKILKIKKGESGCSCGCSDCPSSSYCHKSNKQ